MKALPALLLLLSICTAQAQMFKWVDEKGVIHFSDVPPESGKIKAEIKDYSSMAPDATLPYAVAQAARSNPVTLYTTSQCTACDQGRSLLQERGVPFAEKTVVSDEDQQKLRDAGGEGQVPFLTIGAAKLVGFEAGAWQAALTAATYPTQGMLPKDYQNPAAESAAPRPPGGSAMSPTALAAAAAAAAAAATAPTRPAKPAPKAEAPAVPAIQF